MSEVDVTKNEAFEDEFTGSDKLVPVGEAIRYRKRAQLAENQLSELTEKLATVTGEKEGLKDKLGAIELDQKLSGKLVSAGVNDLEAGLLIAKKRLEDDGSSDVDSVVEHLRKEKEYLFAGGERLKLAGMTSGVKEKASSGRTVLERAGRAAAGSGSRRDVQEYLRVRRQYI
ncbi:MAG: hypothetical protein KAS23_05800 [Anaerohalosphaera sp.]|nr:hypothetical protein [Anaerohalosphaera sp.]